LYVCVHAKSHNSFAKIFTFLKKNPSVECLNDYFGEVDEGSGGPGGACKKAAGWVPASWRAVPLPGGCLRVGSALRKALDGAFPARRPCRRSSNSSLAPGAATSANTRARFDSVWGPPPLPQPGMGRRGRGLGAALLRRGLRVSPAAPGRRGGLRPLLRRRGHRPSLGPQRRRHRRVDHWDGLPHHLVVLGAGEGRVNPPPFLVQGARDVKRGSAGSRRKSAGHKH